MKGLNSSCSTDDVLGAVAMELLHLADMTEDVGAAIAAAIDFTPENLNRLQAIDVAAQTQRLLSGLISGLQARRPVNECFDRIGMETLRRRLIAAMNPVAVDVAA